MESDARVPEPCLLQQIECAVAFRYPGDKAALWTNPDCGEVVERSRERLMFLLFAQLSLRLRVGSTVGGNLVAAIAACLGETLTLRDDGTADQRRGLQLQPVEHLHEPLGADLIAVIPPSEIHYVGSVFDGARVAPMPSSKPSTS